MNKHLLPALALCALATTALSETSVRATHILNRDAPVIDGALDPVWKNADRLALPNPSGNFYRFSAREVMKLDGDMEAGGFVYRPQGPFVIREQQYAQTDPSTWTAYFLHDDINLYIAIETDNDRFVEGSDYDQNSDGFGMALKSRDDKVLKYWLMWFRGKVNADTDPEPSGPPLDRERMCYDAEWQARLNGTWNSGKGQDKGYVFEFMIPLETLGGWRAGDKIPANLILVDHDSNPGGSYDHAASNFMKTSWGAIEDLADLSVPRTIVLSADKPLEIPAYGVAETQDTVLARCISPAIAPRIDGLLDDPVWEKARPLSLPNAVGGTWSMSKSRYNEIDPSVATFLFLHDDNYLYIGMRSTDRMIESAPLDQLDVDQESDGLTSLVLGLSDDAPSAPKKEIRLSVLWNKLDQWGSRLDALLKAAGRPPNPDHFRDVDHDGKKEELHFQAGIPSTPYALDDDGIPIQWAWGPLKSNVWNNPSMQADGYHFEFRIPLRSLGLKPGDKTRANIVVTDHDDNPGKRYNDFQTRYKSFWWGTDRRDLWEYDASGRPSRPVETPAGKERYLQLDTAYPSGGTGAPGKVSRYLAHFDTPGEFTFHDGDARKDSVLGRGYSNAAAALKSAAGAASKLSVRIETGDFDLRKFALLQFLVRSAEPSLKVQVSTKDAAGRSAVVAGRTLDPKDRDAEPGDWHRVAIPIEEIRRLKGDVDLAAIREITVVFPSAREVRVDELAALTYDDLLDNAVGFIAGQQLASTGLVRSFTGSKPAHTYDQAVALLALTDAGRSREAARLARAMMALQEKNGEEGFFRDSYSAIDKTFGQGTDSGVGPNTWMAYALAVYGSRFKDDEAIAAADRVCRWLLAEREIFQKKPGKARGAIRRVWEKLKFWDTPERDEDWEKGTASLFDPKTGGVWAGIVHDPEEGAPTRPDIIGHNRDRMLFWKSTEGVIDAQHLFELMTSLGRDYSKPAAKVRDWMLRGGANSGWNDAGFFNLGHNDFTGADTRIYLDTHTWGSILAKLHGQDEKARRALAKSSEMISTRPFQGGTIRGFNDSRYPENESIWFGGTAHYVAACNYLGQKDSAAEFVDTLLKTQRLSGGWGHSSDDAYMTCFVRKSDGKVVTGYVDQSTGIAYDAPENRGKPDHLFKTDAYPEPDWTGYGTYHNRAEAVGETAWVYFALKGYATGKKLPYTEAAR